MTPEQLKFLDELRDEGYCVIVWTPEEIGNADEGHLEDIATSRGNDYLASFGTGRITQ